MRKQVWIGGWSVFRFTLVSILLAFQLSVLSFAQGRSESEAWGYRGQTAINKLGVLISDVARNHNMSPAELIKSFKEDPNLWVSKNNKLVFLDEFLPQNGAAVSGGETVGAGPYAANQTFLLHSLPGATKVIYLDFDGHTTSGTFWNSNFTSGADIVSAPFDMDNNAAFSATELDRIQYIWQRVAEEFLPFGVDVTTQDPGVDALRNTGSGDTTWGMRVVISPTNYFYQNAGGVAWIGSFSWDSASYHPTSHTPCFVFSNMLGPNSEKFIADAIAHETGHTLGLNHDGANASTMTTATSYYYGNYDTATGTTFAGTPQWAPVMGAGYYQSLTQWSKGEYTGANQLQDDLAVMTASYGITYRTDDHSNTSTGATPMTANGTSVTGKGIIERATDVDYLSFQTGAGAVTFNFTGSPRDPNLDIQVKLFDSNGTQILMNNPTGLTASFTTTLAAGTYYVAVEGVGTGDPLQRFYSDYGSIGEFNISGTVISVAANVAPTATAAGTPTSGAAPLTVNFSSTGSTDTDGSIASYSWNFGNGNTSTSANPSAVYNTAGTYTATLTVTDNGGLTNTAQVIINVTAPLPTAPTNLVAAVATTSQINLTWADNATNESSYSIERSLNNSTWTQIASVGVNTTAFSDTGLTASTLYYYRVRAVNSTGNSAYSNVASATTGTVAPAAPSNLTASAGSSSQINLVWVDGSNNETGFKIERSLNNSTWMPITTVGANITSYSNTGLTAGTLYYYRVRATNSAGDSANSNVASATTTATTTATSSMHIGDIDHTAVKAKSGTTWSTTVTITVHKSTETILANATVTASWSNGTTATCKTGTKGTCTMSLSSLSTSLTNLGFTVTNVTAAGYTYAAASNHDPDGSSNGTTATILRP